MLFTNTLAQSARLITGYLFSFIVAPVMLSRLGLTAFGIWAVTGALATYAGVLDLGVTRSLARFVALYDAQGQPRRIRECVGLGLIAVTLIGGLAVGAAVLAAPLVADVLRVKDVGMMRTVLLSSAGILACQAYVQVLDAVPVGLRRMVPPSVSGIAGNVLNFGFSIGALLLSRHLVEYATANLIASALALGPAVASLLYTARFATPVWPGRETVREVMRFGLQNQVGWLADVINFETDKLVIASIVDVRAAAVYEIAARVVGAIRSVAVLTVSAMIPTMTAYLVKNGRSVIPATYRHYTTRSVAIAFPTFILGCVSAPYLLHAWLGHVPGRTTVILIALSLAYLLQITTGVASTTSLAEGNPGMVARNAVIGAALNIVLTIALASVFGLAGVLAGTFIALAATSALFIVRFHRAYDVPVVDYLRAVLRPGLLAAGLGIPFALWSLLGPASTSRGMAAGTLIVIGALYVTAYAVLAGRMGLLPERMTFPRARRQPVELVPGSPAEL